MMTVVSTSLKINRKLCVCVCHNWTLDPLPTDPTSTIPTYYDVLPQFTQVHYVMPGCKRITVVSSGSSPVPTCPKIFVLWINLIDAYLHCYMLT